MIIRNPTGEEVPPKTLLEAGTMAISYSVAWDAKVVTSAYWVKSDQVSKTAPTGEYLGTGSFMIRGKKNFLPPCHLILGLSFLFKLEDGSVERHKNERRVRNFDEEVDKMSVLIENEKLEEVDEEIDLEDDGEEKVEQNKENSDEEESDEPKFPDTHVKMDHGTGKVEVKTDPKIDKLTSVDAHTEPENVIFLGDNQPYIIPKKPAVKKGQKKTAIFKEKEEVIEEKQRDEAKSNQPKRGQKGKLKKIKEKYKDQDEDERQMRMEILKSDGKTAKDKKKKLEEEEIQKAVRRIPQMHNKQKDTEDDDETPANADVDMLDSLTGAPVDEDELLFAIPVVAPYQSLHNYK